MENCYVEEYLKVATNDSLLGIGESYFGYAKAGSIAHINIYPDVAGQSLRLVGPGFFSDSQGTTLGIDTIELTKWTAVDVYINATGGDTHLVIYDPVYSAPKIEVNDANFYGDLTDYFKFRDIRKNSVFLNMKAALDLDKIKGLGSGNTQLKFSGCRNVTGSINRFSNLTYIGCNQTKCYGSINGLNWSTLTVIGTADSNIGGNIETLGQELPETFTNTIFIGYSPITGSLEKFCENQLAKGRTATIVVGVGNSNATFHGSTTSLDGINTKLEFATNSITIKNNSNNAVLATYNGSTWTYA